jgi:site-specific recombinase XerD
MVDLSRVRLSGPLVAYVHGFAVWLAGRGYPPSSVVYHVRRMAHVSRWMVAHGVEVGAVDSGVVEAFLGVLPAGRRVPRLRPGAFQPTWEYLRVIGAVPPAEPRRPCSAVDVLLERYAGYLAVERGLADATIRRNQDLVRPFLVGLEREGRTVGTMTAGDVTGFMLLTARRQPSSASRAATALRSLLRFLHVEGVIEAEPAAAVPTVARRRLAGLPKALTSTQVAALLASCDRATVVGRRDLAILTVLSRLGLRAGEVARLLLDDIDWRRGEIAVTGKGNRQERLPLPADVGSVVVSYLSDGRPDTAVREVFICAKAPHRPMTRITVTNVVATAARKAGLGTVHAHRLRHSAATAMLRGGASLDEIGQVLRHHHALTTMIYAKVDVEALRTVARRWPGSGAAA